MSVDTDYTVDGLDAIWRLLDPQGNRPSPPRRHLPAQVGPFPWNPIISDGRAPVGGWAKLTRQENGSVHFTGHFYEPGAPSDVTACVFAVRAGDGTVFTFVRSALDEWLGQPATSAGKRPTLWWQVEVVSSDTFAARDVATACRCASRWSRT
jgi:hypothetical protein